MNAGFYERHASPKPAFAIRASGDSRGAEAGFHLSLEGGWAPGRRRIFWLAHLKTRIMGNRGEICGQQSLFGVPRGGIRRRLFTRDRR